MTFRVEVVCLHDGGEQRCSVVEMERAEWALESLGSRMQIFADRLRMARLGHRQHFFHCIRTVNTGSTGSTSACG